MLRATPLVAAGMHATRSVSATRRRVGVARAATGGGWVLVSPLTPYVTPRNFRQRSDGGPYVFAGRWAGQPPSYNSVSPSLAAHETNRLHGPWISTLVPRLEC